MNKKRILVVGIAAVVVIAAAVIGAILRPPAVDVVIDPGHGGNDVGAQYEGRNEKDDNLDLALLVTDNLKDMGGKVKLTSCLAEIGFITSEEDNKLLDDNLNAYAEAIATAIKNTL